MSVPVEPLGQVEFPAAADLQAQVGEGRLGSEAQSPAAGRDAQADVALLQVRGAAEAAIETADVDEDLPAEGHVVAGHMIDVAGMAGVEMPRDAAIVPAHAADTAAGQYLGLGHLFDDAPGDASHPRVGIGCQVPLEQALVGHDVVVDEEDDVASRLADADVARVRQAPGRDVDVAHLQWSVPRQFPQTDGRLGRLIDDDEFPAVEGEGEEPVHGLAQELLPPQGRDDEAGTHAAHAHRTLSSSSDSCSARRRHVWWRAARAPHSAYPLRASGSS